MTRQLVVDPASSHLSSGQIACARIRRSPPKRRMRAGYGQRDSQVNASLQTGTCERTCDGWPNGFASGFASSRKSQKLATFKHIQLTCDQLVSTCVGWPNGEKLASTCVRIWARPKSTQVGGQTRCKSKTFVDLRRLVSSFGQGLTLHQLFLQGCHNLQRMDLEECLLVSYLWHTALYMKCSHFLICCC